MKNVRIIPISIITVILVAFLGLTFGFYNVSEEVAIKGVAGSFAQGYADKNHIEFEELYDSENDNVAIPLPELKDINPDKEEDEINWDLDTPKNVTLNVKSTTTIIITWDEVKDADGYYIFRADLIDGDVSLIKTIESADILSFENEDLLPGVTYFYSVMAYADDDELLSFPSELVFATTAKENDVFAYNYINDSVVVTEYKGSSSEVIIPDTLDNLPVSAVKMEVLGRGITSVQIPNSVTSIEGDYSSSRYDSYLFITVAVALAGYIIAVVATVVGVKKKEKSTGSFFSISTIYGGLIAFILLIAWSSYALYAGVNLVTFIIVAVVLMALSLIGLIGRTSAREIIENRDAEIKQKTLFIKMLTTDAQTLVARAGAETKKSANKVYEAIRFSDAMSVDALAGIESQITIKFNEYSNAVVDNDVDLTKALEKELLILIADRNNKCKMLK